MIRSMKGTILTLFVAAAGAALAQNSDLGLLAGISGPKGETSVSGGTVSASGSVAPSFQANYAWQVVESKADLYVELPFVAVIRSSATVVTGPGGEIASSSGSNFFLTPGVRLKISPESRVSLYCAAGGGLGSFSGTSITTSGGLFVSSSRQNSLAGGFGGGVDFRLTRLLSLRVDVRDFVTKAGLGGAIGRNHGIGQFGIAFHF